VGENCTFQQSIINLETQRRNNILQIIRQRENSKENVMRVYHNKKLIIPSSLLIQQCQCNTPNLSFLNPLHLQSENASPHPRSTTPRHSAISNLQSANSRHLRKWKLEISSE
jgi:hypothetical protein